YLITKSFLTAIENILNYIQSAGLVEALYAKEAAGNLDPYELNHSILLAIEGFFHCTDLLPSAAPALQAKIVSFHDLLLKAIAAIQCRNPDPLTLAYNRSLWMQVEADGAQIVNRLERTISEW